MSLDARSFGILEPAENVNYGRDEVPSARDGQIRDLVLHAAGSWAFEEIVRIVPRGADRVLGAFAERAASMAVRRQDVRELRAGLLAAAIAQETSGDPREALAALSLLYRAAEMIGHDPDVEFSALNEFSGGRAGGLLDFLRRSPEDKAIEAMGYEEGDDKRGFRFLRNW
ncbi:hypothetical protein Ssi03_68370 [Sphaerisporangium siamense]|uniref:Uncharacterized protein n=1 Tax=Sphaerisporangium siamense TaxID=795645 RepID=A0A7W7D608_9ACTN|nr:hypothetical protein [Sphaerisporangium siamense]MBB4700624.1 hypothetical protein [Sphaerisporangium siamense]GII88847.1 hypothetical protein Ssi03_68370 [Sphaerisporangium siamense]